MVSSSPSIVCREISSGQVSLNIAFLLAADSIVAVSLVIAVITAARAAMNPTTKAAPPEKITPANAVAPMPPPTVPVIILLHREDAALSKKTSLSLDSFSFAFPNSLVSVPKVLESKESVVIQ